MKTFKLLAVILSLLIAHFTGFGQCLPPVGLSTTARTTTSATLNWTSQNLPIADHCWTIEIFASNGSCNSGQFIFRQTVCTSTAGVTWNASNGQVSYTATNLQPGTSYIFSLVETCNRNQGNSGSCSNALSPIFQTFDAPFTVTYTASPPTCQEGQPSCTPNGSISVTITDATSCPGTIYDIVVTPNLNSSPLGASPPFTIPNVVFNATAAGSPYLFTGAGAGIYTITVFEVGPCNPNPNPEVVLAIVPNGTGICP